MGSERRRRGSRLTNCGILKASVTAQVEAFSCRVSPTSKPAIHDAPGSLLMLGYCSCKLFENPDAASSLLTIRFGILICLVLVVSFVHTVTRTAIGSHHRTELTSRSGISDTLAICGDHPSSRFPGTHGSGNRWTPRLWQWCLCHLAARTLNEVSFLAACWPSIAGSIFNLSDLS